MARLGYSRVTWRQDVLFSVLRAWLKSRSHASYKPQLTNHTGCENAQLVSALDSDDPGTLNVGQVFANGFPFELVNAAFGQDLASDDVKSKMTPVGTGSDWGPESCLKRCGITKPGA
jgi:hypothetical protein